MAARSLRETPRYGNRKGARCQLIRRRRCVVPRSARSGTDVMPRSRASRIRVAAVAHHERYTSNSRPPRPEPPPPAVRACNVRLLLEVVGSRSTFRQNAPPPAASPYSVCNPKVEPAARRQKGTPGRRSAASRAEQEWSIVTAATTRRIQPRRRPPRRSSRHRRCSTNESPATYREPRKGTGRYGTSSGRKEAKKDIASKR